MSNTGAMLVELEHVEGVCGALPVERGVLEWLGCERYRARVQWTPGPGNVDVDNAGVGNAGAGLTVRLPWVLDVRDGRTWVLLVPTSVTRGARARGGTGEDAALVVERILEALRAVGG
jgi:hypothetical protein